MGNEQEQTLGLDAPRAPRSVPPAEFLIPDIHQVVGHTVACQRLVRWLNPAVSAEAQAASVGSLLCLVPAELRYALVIPADARNASSSILFADVGLATCAVGSAEFLRLEQPDRVTADTGIR